MSQARVICGKVEDKGNSWVGRGAGEGDAELTSTTGRTVTKHVSESEAQFLIDLNGRMRERRAIQLAMNIGKSSRQPVVIAGFVAAKRPSEWISEHGGVSEQVVL